MIRFINEHRYRFGVELICRVLRPAVQGSLTARGYRAAVGHAPSARQLKDDLLVPEVARLHAENYGVYGRRKMNALMRRQGWDNSRLHGEIDMRTPIEVETAYYADLESANPAPAEQDSR